MREEITAATQLVLVCNPNNPTGTHLPAARVAEFLEGVPAHATVILDEAYVEFQTHDDPDASLDLLKDFPNLVVLRTFSKCYGLAGLRVGYGIGSANFRAAVDAVRQPFSVNALAQAAGAEAILHQDDVLRRVESTIAARLTVGEPPTPTPTSPGSTSATPTRRRSSPASPRRRLPSAPARPSAAPATSGSAMARRRRTSVSSASYRNYLTNRDTVIEPHNQ
jgi:histidinol-phosphate aminotransferase